MPRSRDVVFGPFDSLDGHGRYLANVNFFASHGERVLCNLAPLENALDGREVKFGGHIHHGEVFVVELIVLVVITGLASGDARDLIRKRRRVLFPVHRHKGRELEQAWIHFATDAAVLKANALDHEFFQLAHRDPAPKVGHIRGRRIRVNRAADQGQRFGLGFGVFFGQISGRSQRQRRRLAHGDHMRVRAKVAHVIHQIERVIFDIEFSGADWNVAGVVPIGHVKLAIRQERDHGRAQECRIMARHGGDQ